jgi:hypothetical protein
MRAAISNFSLVLPALLAASQVAAAEDTKAIQQQLESKYPLTVINAEGVIVRQGAVLVLKKSGLTASSISCTNDYKPDGTIALAGISKATCELRRIPIHIPGVQRTRKFVEGEKLYVTKIEVEDTVKFSLVSDPIDNVVYKVELRFSREANCAQQERLVSEVFDVQAEAPPPPPPPEHSPEQPKLPDIPPPEPPADAPAAQPPTVSLGMTIDRVVEIMYLYGMVTGGASASSPFAFGQYAQAVDAAGYAAAALSYGVNGGQREK